MTVAQLVKMLIPYPTDAEVLAYSADDCVNRPVTGVLVDVGLNRLYLETDDIS